MPYLAVFVYLQLLDFMTTIVGLHLGGVELCPFVRSLMALGPATGILIAKAGAVLLAIVCIWFHKERVIRWANYYFAALVVWNMVQILRAVA